MDTIQYILFNSLDQGILRFEYTVCYFIYRFNTDN